MKSFKWFIALALLSLGTAALASESSHRQAAVDALDAMKVKQMFSMSIDQLVEVQLQQNPALQAKKQVLHKFFDDYMSFDSLRDEVVSLYTAEFSEAELKQIAAFYRSPVGRKITDKMPDLLGKAAQIGAQRVQEHMPELQKMLEAKPAK